MNKLNIFLITLIFFVTEINTGNKHFPINSLLEYFLFLNNESYNESPEYPQTYKLQKFSPWTMETAGAVYNLKKQEQDSQANKRDKGCCYCEYGTTGTTGTTGDRGTPGTTGSKGATGNTGERGYTGDHGTTGTTGTKGEAGYAGTTGTTGPKGDLGNAGTTGTTGSVGSQGTTGSTGPQGLPGVSGDGQLVFTAPDMSKSGQNPDTSFNNVYSSGNCKLQVWKLKPSKSGDDGISLMFGLPDDYKAGGLMEFTFYLLAQKHEGSSGDTANIKIYYDFKGNYQEIGSDFISTVNTGNFQVIEPSGSTQLENIIVKVSLPITGLSPENWIFLVFERVLPENSFIEYSKDIYLSSVVIRYEKN